MGRRAQGEGRCYLGGTAPIRYSSGRLCSVRLGVMVLRSALKADHGCGGFVLAVPLNRLYLGTVGLFLFRDLRGLAVGFRVGRFR